MDTLQSLYADVILRLSGRSWLAWLDLVLVIITFYLLLNWVRHSRAAFLLRGALVLGIVLFAATMLLPLPTFDWLVRGVLIAMLVATAVIFQPELRRVLERVGRSAGLAWAVRQTAAESVLSELVSAVEHLSSGYTGALIALEGNQSLHDVVETGIPIGGRVTSELLQAIFYPENPLHDGAAILREDQVVAASCVLPLTERPLYFKRRLGTRHRAAVGLSESSDALVVVVSEETGAISVAREGKLHRPLDSATLREQIYHFYVPSVPASQSLSLGSLLRRTVRRLWRRPRLPTARDLLANLSLLFVSLLLALVAWSFVTEQTNPARRALIEDIPLRTADIPSGTILMKPPPATVSALVQTTNDVLPTLRPSTFQAVASLKGLSPGLHHLEVQVNSSASQVRVLSVDPSTVDLELAAVISRPIGVTIDLTNQQNLPPAYEMVGEPIATPGQVLVIGAEPLVEQVSQVRTTISLANVTASLEELRPLQALDESGREVTGVTLQPAQVRVNVNIRRRFNALDVGVRAVVEGTPLPGYWLSDLRVTPSSVTLQGEPDRLAQIGSFINTLPVDISGAAGDISVQIPLDLPPGVEVLNGGDNATKTVSVLARIAASTGNLAVTRRVELLGVTPGVTITVSPPRVDLLLSGPLPILNEIEAAPDLVQVVVDVTGLTLGQSVNLTPTVLAPDNVDVRPVPSSVRVTSPSS